MNKAIITHIDLSGIELEVFMLSDGSYVMSQSQVSLAVEVHRNGMLRFLESKQLECSDSNSLGCYKTCEFTFNDKNGNSRGKIKGVSIDLASEFWLHQAIKGNKLAQSLAYACLQESLKRRCDAAFNTVKTENEYEQDSFDSRTSWLESRAFLKDAHISFMNCCYYNGFNGAVAHDTITKAVCGKTARELRFEELINGDPKIGLNHIEVTDDLIKIAKVKLEFSRYKVGNVHQRVKRAVEKLGYN